MYLPRAGESIASNHVCQCCGSNINDLQNFKGPYGHNPYKIVCTECWHKPFLHFPDKTVGIDGLSYPVTSDKTDSPKLRIWNGELKKSKLNVLLVEPDYYTRYPPLGLLKLSAFHKSRGDVVTLVRYPEKPIIKPDLIYTTSLFTFSWRNVHEAVKYYKGLFPKTKVILGGIYTSLLPDHAMNSGADFLYVGYSKELDNLRPDYSLIEKWGWKANILFSSRGCVRRCGFCAIPTLEGKITAKSTILDLIDQRFKKVVFWDNNILATSSWRKIFAELRELKYEVDFNQGLDARLIDEEVAEEISHLKIRLVRLAYDNSKDRDAVDEAISLLSKTGISKRKIIVYTLFNYTDTPADFLIRIKQLLRNGVVAYPMRYEPLCALQKNAFVSPNWTLQQLDLVQKARRVIGYAGSFPPYAPLIEKLGVDKSFEEAFELRPSLEEIERKLCLGEEEARLVYTYYKKHDLTKSKLPLQSALLRIRAREQVEDTQLFPLVADRNRKREQRRLGGSNDWR